jgi:hypothetical protein
MKEKSSQNNNNNNNKKKIRYIGTSKGHFLIASHNDQKEDLIIRPNQLIFSHAFIEKSGLLTALSLSLSLSLSL